MRFTEVVSCWLLATDVLQWRCAPNPPWVHTLVSGDIKKSVSSSSGPGLLVLIQAIAGSNPAEITRKIKKTRRVLFVFLIFGGGMRTRRVRSWWEPSKYPKLALDILRRRPTNWFVRQHKSKSRRDHQDIKRSQLWLVFVFNEAWGEYPTKITGIRGRLHVGLILIPPKSPSQN